MKCSWWPAGLRSRLKSYQISRRNMRTDRLKLTVRVEWPARTESDPSNNHYPAGREVGDGGILERFATWWAGRF